MPGCLPDRSDRHSTRYSTRLIFGHMDIDVGVLLGAVVREVAMSQRDGVDTRLVRATREFDTTVEALWEAVTSPERLPRWFLPVSGDLRVGGRFQIEGNAGGEVLECNPPEHLAVTWEA